MTVVLGILGVTALGKFQDLSNEAQHVMVNTIHLNVKNYLNSVNTLRYPLEGSPDNSTYVMIDGVDVRFRNGLLRNARNPNNVPPGIPQRGNQATRLWYMAFNVPPPVISRNDTSSTGWAICSNGVELYLIRL